MRSKHLKYLILLFCIISIFTKNAYAQDNKLEHYYQQGLKYELENVDSALYYFNIIDSLAYAIKDSLKIVESAIFISSYHQIAGNIEISKKHILDALPYVKTTADSVLLLNTLTSTIKEYDPKTTDSLFLKTIALATKDSLKELSSIYNNYGRILHKKGDLGKAAFYQQQAAEVSTTDYMRYQLYTSLLNIFEALGNMDLSAEYIEKATAIAEKNDYKSKNGMLTLHKVKYLVKVDKINEAKIELDKGLAYETKLRPKSYEIAKVISSRMYYTATKEWKLFQTYLNERENIFKKYKIDQHPTILNAKAKCSFELGDFKMAEKWANQALRQSKKRNLKADQIRSNTLLGAIYTAQNKFKKAVEFKDISKKQSDEYFRNTKAQNIIYLEAAYNRKQQQQAIKELNRENQIQEENISRKNLYLQLGSLALALFSILLFILYRLYKKVNQQKKVISKSLSEKDLLLREIHHRVKNNLQLVSSLLTMQGRSIDDETTIQAINEGKSRVRSMALIHQDLYNKENITGISVKDYIEKLTQELLYTYKISDDDIKLELDINDIELDVDTVVPLGLIINELVTNSLKYAWPNQNHGRLSISLKQSQDLLKLTISDDGIGYNPLKVREESFGSTLISALTLQLNGECEVITTNGTKTIISMDTSRT